MSAAHHVDYIAGESASVALGEPQAVHGEDRAAGVLIVVERTLKSRTADRRPCRRECLNESVPIGLQRCYVRRYCFAELPVWPNIGFLQ